MKHFIGNDLVDLNTLDANNYPSSPRFVERVMCIEEQKFLYEQEQQKVIFWIFWSAKEAVYKITKKMNPETVFSHSSYHLKLTEWSSNSGTAKGYVIHQGTHYPVTFTVTINWVHCVATTHSEVGTVISDVKHYDEIHSSDVPFTECELESIHSKESLFVRYLTKSLLKGSTSQEFEIRRTKLLTKYGPPEIWQNKLKVSALDVSMSHDGNYCASCVLRRE